MGSYMEHTLRDRLLTVVLVLRERYKRTYIVNAIDRLLPIIRSENVMAEDQISTLMTTFSLTGDSVDDYTAVLKMMQETVKRWWSAARLTYAVEINDVIEAVKTLEYIAYPDSIFKQGKRVQAAYKRMF